MTQAAVSYQIRILEERVGGPLFVRRPRGVELSDTGRQFAKHVSDAMDILGDAFAEARGQTEERLSISVIPTFATNFLAQRLSAFHLENPSISVRIEVNEALTDFDAGEFDVGIRGGMGKWPGLASHKLMQADFTPMLSPKLADTIGGLREPADILKLPVIACDDPWWHTWFEAAGLTDVDLSMQTGLYLGTQILEANAAIAGQGVGLLTPAFHRDALELGLLIQPFDLTCSDGSGFWLVCPQSRRNTRKITVFRQWLDKALTGFGH